MPEKSSIHAAYRSAVEFLYSLRLFGAKFGLENSFKLAALAGNPQTQLRFIHVAGTNGKGSTCAMLESIYRQAGLRVGLFTSPHLVSFRERIQVGRELVSEGEVVRSVEAIKPLLAQFPADHHPTFFEVAAVMALTYFAQEQCDLVIWETGLGGRLDATNIVTPLASVITNIGLDHQQWLGDTLEKIAVEKAGIIKPGVPVVTATNQPAAFVVIEQAANFAKAPLKRVERLPPSISHLPSSFPLAGEHQRLNAALALATVEILQQKIPVSERAIRKGLEKVRWAGRLQLVTRPGGQKILLDGAHNPDGAQALSLALEREFPGETKTMILGVFRDKDTGRICELLAPNAVRLVLVPVHSERSEDPEKLATACRAANSDATIEICQSLDAAMEWTSGEPFVVIAGSLYLVGEALELLGLAGASDQDEKPLNEWMANIPRAPSQ